LVETYENPVFVIDGWPGWKYKIHPTYKSSRVKEREKDPSHEVKSRVKGTLRNSLIQYLPTVVAYHPDEEADDCIATLAVRLKDAGVQVTILSSDKDLWQLLDPKIRIHTPSTQEAGYVEVTPERVMDAFGCPKEKIALHKTWLGDSGDDVPKVFRLPTKLALQVINSCNNVEESIERIPSILTDPKQAKWKDAMLEFSAQARVNWELVSMKLGIDVGFAYFRSEPQALQALLDSYSVRKFSALDIFNALIPHQDNALRILNNHGFLTKVLQFEEVYKKETN
jgi:5'-3' exonuclease